MKEPASRIAVPSRLRWRVELDEAGHPADKILQQAWEVVEFDINDMPTNLHIEWRDVPVVKP